MEKRMKVYSLPTCGPCKTAKWLLDNKNIKYEVEDFNEHRERLSEQGFYRAPVFEIDGQLTSTPGKALELHVKSSVAYA